MPCCKLTLLLLEAAVFRAFAATFGSMVIFDLDKRLGYAEIVSLTPFYLTKPGAVFHSRL